MRIKIGIDGSKGREPNKRENSYITVIYETRRRGMVKSTLLAVSLFVGLTSSIAYAQLGPKDGVKLKPTDLERVKVGDAAPDFTLENMDGNRITLSDLRNKKNVVLVFYRGHW
jgi:cytochrome oxidase Cu insertion factor (SCO1/SenC/PrrC family)